MIAEIPNQNQPVLDGSFFQRPWYRFLGLISRSKPVGYRPVASGFATLVAGTVTVQTKAYVTGNGIQLTRNVTGGMVGNLTVGAVVDGVSFAINSTNAAETSTVFWTVYAPIV